MSRYRLIENGPGEPDVIQVLVFASTVDKDGHPVSKWENMDMQDILGELQDLEREVEDHL